MKARILGERLDRRAVLINIDSADKDGNQLLLPLLGIVYKKKKNHFLAFVAITRKTETTIIGIVTDDTC